MHLTARRWPWRYAARGLLAGAAGMAVGHLLAAWLDPAASPVLAVGSTVIDMQTERRAEPFPSGASGYHSIVVNVA